MGGGDVTAAIAQSAPTQVSTPSTAHAHAHTPAAPVAFAWMSCRDARYFRKTSVSLHMHKLSCERLKSKRLRFLYSSLAVRPKSQAEDEGSCLHP